MNSFKNKFFYGSKHLLDYIVFGYFRSPFNLGIEITNKCNLNCKTCYFHKEKKKKELSDREWESRINQIIKNNPSIIQALWLGGEPMMRFELIKKISTKFYKNIIFTNGTFPLIPLPNTKYSISIDGIEGSYEKQRGENYQLVKRNILQSKVDNLNIVFLISNLNVDGITDFVKFWSEIRNINRIIFSFYSPNVSEDCKYWIDFEEREKIIEKINLLSRHYPKTIESAQHLKMLNSENITETVENCWKTRNNNSIFLDSQGRVKNNAYCSNKGFKVSCGSRKVDCLKCGCDYLSRISYMKQNRTKHLLEVAKRNFNQKH